MSTRIHLILGLCLIMSVIAQSCKTHPPGEDPEDNPLISADAKGALTKHSSKTWKPSYYTVNGIKEPLKDCEKDDRWTFFSYDSLRFKYGADHCYLNEPDSEGTSYKLYGDNTQILIGIVSYKVFELLNDRFTIIAKDSVNRQRALHMVPGN